jgi:sialidase-1
MKHLKHIGVAFVLLAMVSMGSADESIGWNQDNKIFKPTSAHEGKLSAFLGQPVMNLRPMFPGGRFPNVVVATDGSVLAFFGGVGLRRSVDGGESWGRPVTVAQGFIGGGVTVDEISGDIFAFVEEAHPPAPLRVFASKDHGLTWEERDFVIHPNAMGHVPSMHMNDHGISLRHGPYKGRLIRPSRWYGRSNYPREVFHTHYTNAIFSDDGGRSWQASAPVPVMGTGEACIIERSDGTLYYNTRRHWAPTQREALWRWSAVSRDGGATWVDAKRSEVLPDGNRDSTYGLMGGLVRLPVAGRDVLLFSNVLSERGRRGGHVWASFDGGDSWPVRREVFSGSFAYSSMNAGRLGTASEGLIYLLFEGGPEAAGTIACFNLSWVLQGEPTGDGAVPDWVGP